MVRYCGRLREVIFFLSMVPRATGDVRGVFGGPLATCSSNMFGVVEPNTATATPADSCADLTEATGAESDSEAECTAQSEKSTATTRRGPLQTPTPSQVVIAAARARAKKMNRSETNKEGAQIATGDNGGGGSDSNNSI